MGYTILIVGLLELSIALWMGLIDFGRRVWIAPATRFLCAVQVGLVSLELFFGSVSGKAVAGVVGFVIIPIFLASCLLAWGRRIIGGGAYLTVAASTSVSIIAGLIWWVTSIRFEA